MAQWLLLGRKGRRRAAGHEDLTGLAADREIRDGLSSAPSMTSAGTLSVAVSPRKWSLSGLLCARHSMTTRSMNATQDEDRYGGQDGAAANSG